MPGISQSKTVHIVKRADGRLGPDGNIRIAIATGGTVVFTFPAGATKQSITFQQGRSPFGAQPVSYNVPLAVTATKSLSKPDDNVYRFDCAMTLDGHTIDSRGGGEIEIVGG